MGRKILCEKCGSVLNEDILKEKNSMNTCLVCGASLGGDDTQDEPEEELITWYYYKFKIDPESGSLRDKLIDTDGWEDVYDLAYTFQAPPRDKNGSSEKAKEVLRREYDPTAFAPPNPNEDIKYKLPQQLIAEGRCPRCGSSNIQVVQKKWSIWTGFRTNAMQRVCVNCMHKF